MWNNIVSFLFYMKTVYFILGCKESSEAINGFLSLINLTRNFKELKEFALNNFDFVDVEDISGYAYSTKSSLESDNKNKLKYCIYSCNVYL